MNTLQAVKQDILKGLFPTPYWGVVHEQHNLKLFIEKFGKEFPTPYWGVVHEPCRLYPLV